MKKPLLITLICLVAAVSSALIVETGSLKSFLIGGEPNTQYDNWLSHMAEGIAIPNYNLYAPYDVQTNGFGNFRLPDANDILYWNNMLDLFNAGNYEGAQAILTAAGAPFQVTQFNDTDTGRSYYMIRELPNYTYYDDNGTFNAYDDEVGAFAYGWGLFIYNPEGSKPIIITVVHPCDDFPTPMFGYYALNTWNARYLMINGAGREVRWTNVAPYTNAKSLSDPTRNATHPFQLAYKKFADNIRSQFGWREFSTQVHSYDWNRHSGYANCQISAGNPRLCPNLPIRDLSALKHDLINQGEHLMIPENTVGIHRNVYLNDFYAVNYGLYDFTFTDGEQTYAVNGDVDLPAYTQNQQMLYTQSGTTDYDVYEPFFHMEMDELPNCYEETENAYKWFYGWDEASQQWDMSNLFANYISYYGRWVDDMEPVLVEMFQMNDNVNPTNPTGLYVLNQSLNNVTLSWTRSSAYDFDSYEILYAQEPIGTDNYLVFNRTNNALLASQACESIAVTGLNNAYQYYFRIRAKDKNGNYSEISNEVNAILAPANVTSLTAYGLDNSVRVYWTVSGQTNNQGFKVYRKQGTGNYVMVDSWLTNPALANSAAYSFEWWDITAVNGVDYSYKVSSTNLSNVEFFYNFPASAMPSPINTITISNSLGTLNDSVSFGINPYASDGQDTYWDVSKANPGTNYVWNAFWEQYWGSSGTQLAREIKGAYNLDTDVKTWIMRVRSDQLTSLNITASGDFNRTEKLYLQDGGNGNYHNLLSGPYQFTNANSNVRTMTLFWGNMQPRALISAQSNKIYQSGGTINFYWNYQYPFLIDHMTLSLISPTDSLMINPLVTNSQYSYSYQIPQDLPEMQDCRFVIDVFAVDGVRTQFRSDFHFSIVPQLYTIQNGGGWETRSNPWLNSDLSFEQVFGAGALGYREDQTQTPDFDFGLGYWVYSPSASTFSYSGPIQATEFSTGLTTGWNLIANPHLCAYDIEDLSFSVNGALFRFSELLSQQLVSRAVYVLRDGILEPVSRIEPCEAFLIKYYGSAPLSTSIRFYPFFSGPGIDPQPADWQLKVNLAQQVTSRSLRLGGHLNATNGFDLKLDLPVAPQAPFLLAEMWFPTPDSTSLENKLQSDFRPNFTAGGQQEFWNFKLSVGETSPLLFTFDQTDFTPGWQAQMVLNGVAYTIGSSPSFSWTPPAAGIYEGYIRVRNYPLAADDMVQVPFSGLTAYPNPFNPDVKIAFSLGGSTSVKVEIFNIKGQKVKSLLHERLSSGQHSLAWDGKDDAGKNVSSGVYFTRVQTPNKTQVIKMIMLK